MYLTNKKYRNILILYGVLLLIFVLTGCQKDHVFRWGETLPTPTGDSFIVVGDSQSGVEIYRDIVDSVASSLSFAKCFIHVGDMIDDPGNQAQWQHFLDIMAPVSDVMPWYAVIGNHDINSMSSQQIYQDVMEFPSNQLYYSFDLMNSHFIILDTEIPGQRKEITGEQLAWLRNDLQISASSAQYLFVFMHRCPFPQGSNRGRNLTNASELHELFSQYGVDIVFAGHEHQYYIFSKDSIYYVVTGGGGGPVHSDEGIGEGFHHFLLVELLPPDTVLIHVLDVYGRVIQTDIAAKN